MKNFLFSCLLIFGCNSTPKITTEKFYDTNSTELGYLLKSITVDNYIVIKRFLNGTNPNNTPYIQDGIWCITINSKDFFFSTENKNSMTENLKALDDNYNENYQFSISSSWLGWQNDEDVANRKLMQLDGTLEHPNIFSFQENQFIKENMDEINARMADLSRRNESSGLSMASITSYASQLTYFSFANLWLKNGGLHTPCYMMKLLNNFNSSTKTEEISLERINQNNIKIGGELISNDQLKEIISSIELL